MTEKYVVGNPVKVYPQDAMNEAVRLIKAFDLDNDAASAALEVSERIAAATMYANLAIAHELKRIGDLMALAQFPDADED